MRADFRGFGALITLFVVILSSSCSFPGIPQRDPLLPVPVHRPEIEVDADLTPEVLDDRSVLKFAGRLSDRFDPGGAGEGRGGFSSVALVFELEPDVPSPDAPPHATLRLSAPYGNLPRLRLGATYKVRWEVVEEDPLGMPDLRIEIRSEEGQLLYLMTTGAALPKEPLMEGLELRSARRPAFLTDFEAGGGCRVRRRHYTTLVRHSSLETGEVWLMPTDVLDLSLETGTWRLTVLDNSVALKGGCDRLIAQELAHRTVVLQFVE